jgi:hypothetical protein
MCGSAAALGSFNPWEMVATAVIGSVLSSAMAPKQQSAPAIAPPAPAPQAAKTPEVAQVARDTSASAAGGEASTLLTGLGGVDPKKLNLGANTLLGQ